MNLKKDVMTGYDDNFSFQNNSDIKILVFDKLRNFLFS